VFFGFDLVVFWILLEVLMNVFKYVCLFLVDVVIMYGIDSLVFWVYDYGDVKVYGMGGLGDGCGIVGMCE